MKFVTTALEAAYLAGETDVRTEQLKSAAALLVLRHDTLKLIDGPGPHARHIDENKAEPARANGKEPPQQSTQAETFQSHEETAKEQEPSPTSSNCLFSGELVPIDLKRFTDSSISLVECPHCGRMRSLSPSKGVLRFKPHPPRKQQTALTDRR